MLSAPTDASTRNEQNGGRGCAVVLAASTGIGLLVAAAMMYIAWDHNAQGEIHNEDGIDWGYWLLIGFLWFILGTIIPLAIGAFIVAASQRAQRRQSI